MTWPEIVELALDGIAQGGQGVGRWEGRVVFAAGGLPGEQVHVRLYECHEAYAHGEVIQILSASPDRVEPRLPGADHIPWQHIAYPAQLGFKRQILAEQLAKIASLTDVVVEETVPASPPWGYRNSAQIHAADGQAGYHAAGTRELRPIDHDPLLLPALNEALAALNRALPPDTRPVEAMLRVSEAYGYVVAALRGRGDLLPLALRWRAACPRLAGVTLPGGSGTGAGTLVEELAGTVFQLRPETFFQVNVESAEALLGFIEAGLGRVDGQRLLDLFCGAGAFALPLARRAAEVLGVEEYPGAVEDAEASAALNQIDNARFVTGRVERVLATLDEPFDAVILDPPRRGCHPEALRELLRLASPRLIYISCHPATLARDLKTLVEGGYQVEQVRPIDLFPQTPHVESVVVLGRSYEHNR
jgi:23S rRNA (uracil1939-C5)-methyltransferase